jgi:hypothetical protein
MKKSKHHMPLKERFERFFERRGHDECWIWKAAVDQNGYGRFQIGRSNLRSHRASYIIYKGSIPDSMHILHSCDNPACVNPQHLKADTNLQNQHEAWMRDRKYAVRKLSRNDVIEIMAAAGKQSVIAARYGIHQCEVSRIKSGKRGVGILMMESYIQDVGG